VSHPTFIPVTTFPCSCYPKNTMYKLKAVASSAQRLMGQYGHTKRIYIYICAVLYITPTIGFTNHTRLPVMTSYESMNVSTSILEWTRRDSTHPLVRFLVVDCGRSFLARTPISAILTQGSAPHTSVRFFGDVWRVANSPLARDYNSVNFIIVKLKPPFPI
jgi:hypothetical protein